MKLKEVYDSIKFAVVMVIGAGVISIITWLARDDPNLEILLYGGPEKETDDE